MSPKTSVLGLCGSLRVDSWNLKLLKNFLAAMPTDSFQTRLYGSLELPLMNQDLETPPLPQSVLDLRAALEASPVVVIGSPEYNSSYSPVIKNAIDWASRPPKNLWDGKLVVLLGASPGMFGGARGQIHLRSVLANQRSWVMPDLVVCPKAHEAFGGDGTLLNEHVAKQIATAIQGLTAFAEKQLR